MTRKISIVMSMRLQFAKSDNIKLQSKLQDNENTMKSVSLNVKFSNGSSISKIYLENGKILKYEFP